MPFSLPPSLPPSPPPSLPFALPRFMLEAIAAKPWGHGSNADFSTEVLCYVPLASRVSPTVKFVIMSDTKHHNINYHYR